jgi:hypothetical protein
MVETNLSPVYDTFIEFVVEKATPEAILDYQLSPEEKSRAIELLERNNAGTLTTEETQELEQMQQVDRLVTALKARALEALAR